MNHWLKLVILGVSATAVLATGTAAIASIGGPDGIISGCPQTNSGSIRVIDNQAGQACRKPETAVNRNQRGPVSPRGPRDPGGLVDLGSVYTSSGQGAVNLSNYTVIARLDLPAGNFLIMGKGLALNQTGQSALVACNVYRGTTLLDTADATLPQAQLIGNVSSYATIPFLATLNQATAGRVRVECIEGQGPASAPFPRISVKLAGQRVGTLVPQSSAN